MSELALGPLGLSYGTDDRRAWMTMDAEERGGAPHALLLRPGQAADSIHHSTWAALGVSSWARAFPGTARQVSSARRFVTSLMDGSPLRDDAVVVVSELFTNAVRHTRSGLPGGLVVVQLSRWLLGVRIAVTDQGSALQPVIRSPGSYREPIDSGNGLYLVARLSRRLEWHDDPSGRTVYAVLGRPLNGYRPAERGASIPSSLPVPLPQPV
jgi:serine/threonine-protein kinase RsbW